MSVLEISRVDRLSRTYDLAPLFPGLNLTGATTSVALLPKNADPTAATVWTSATLAAGSVTVLLAGPDADSTGALVVPASADLWVKVTATPQVDAAKLERVTVLGGGATLVAPTGIPVISVNGHLGATVTLTAADVGAPSTSTYTAGLAGKQDKSTLGADVAADATVRAAFERKNAAPPASLLRSPAPVSPSVLAGDNFTGTAGTSLVGRSGNIGTASPWTVVSGTWQLDGSGNVSPTDGTDGLIAVMTVPASVSPQSYTVSADVLISSSGGASNQAGMIFRYVDAANFWLLNPPVLGGNDWQLYKVVGGGYTQVLQFGLPKANGATVNMRADVWGRDITVFIDDVEVYTATDPAHQGASKIGLRQGQSGGSTVPVKFSNLQVTSYAGAKFNIPRLDTGPSQRALSRGASGSWEDADVANPNVVWDPVNKRWVMHYSGYKVGTSGTVLGMGLAYADTLDGPFVKDPANPIVPATGGNIENGGIVYHAGRWIRVTDNGGFSTSPDLHTWTPLTTYGIPPVGDPFLRVNENGLLECWYGVNIPATQIMRATSADGGITWDVPATPTITVPAHSQTRGHGEPSVYVPPGKEGVEAIVFVDAIIEAAGHGVITAVVTVDGGTTWHWHQIAGGSGSGDDAFQKYDSSPVFYDGVFYLFHSASPLPGGELNLDATIGRMSVQWTQTPDPGGTHPIPYQ